MNKKFLKYVSFNMFSQVALSCYILADTLFIANGVGLDGLAALNIVLPIYNIIFAVGLLLAVGGSTLYSIARAQKQNDKASSYYTYCIIIGLIFSLVIMIPFILFPYQSVTLLGADHQILDTAVIYLKNFIIFTPFFILSSILVAFIRNDDNPKLASIAMISSTMFNILFDYLLIYPMNMGMQGAALATGCSPIVSILICFIHILQKKNRFHFVKQKIIFSRLIKLIKIGIPAFITELSGGIIIFSFNTIILSISNNIAVASYGILSNLGIVISGLYTGLSQGIQPLISYSYGLNNDNEIKKYLSMAITSSLTISIIVFISTILFPNIIVSWFNSENSMIMQDIAVTALPLYVSAFFFIGINMILTSYFSSITNVKPSSIISILRGGFILIPIAILLSKLLGLTGVWPSYPISECIIMFIGIYLKNNKTKKICINT